MAIILGKPDKGLDNLGSAFIGDGILSGRTIYSRRQEQGLTGHLQCISDGLKPLSIIKNIIHEVAGSRGIQHQMLNAGFGLVAGYLFRKLLVTSQSGPLKKIIGVALQFGITRLVGKKGDAIRARGSQFLRSLLVNYNTNGSQ